MEIQFCDGKLNVQLGGSKMKVKLGGSMMKVDCIWYSGHSIQTLKAYDLKACQIYQHHFFLPYFVVL